MPSIKYWILLILSFFLSVASASNIHDHFQVVASYEDYVTAFQQTEQSLDRRLFVSVVTTATSFRNAGGVIVEVFGEENATLLLKSLPEAPRPAKSNTIADQLQSRLAPLTFQTFADLFAKVLAKRSVNVTSDVVKRSFFEMTSINLRTRESYMAIGWNVRLALNELLFESSQGILPLFESFFRRTPLQDRRIVSLEASIAFFGSAPRLVQLLELRKLAKHYGTKLIWFAGVKRSLLTGVSDFEFQKQLDAIKTLVKHKSIDGVDITGSIFEDSAKEMVLPPEAIPRAQLRLKSLVILLSEALAEKVPLRIHSFEASNSGDYYKILFGALDALKGYSGTLSEIRIGHIAHLSFNDIQRFRRIKESTGVKFFFEVNVASNHDLQNIELSALVITMNNLALYDLNFGLGVDGAGVFGKEAQLTEMLKTLESHGLSNKALRTIIKNAQ